MIMHKPLLLASLVTLTATASASPDAKPRAQHAFYRIDVSITGLDGKTAPTTYSMVLEETRYGKLSSRVNIPLGAGANGATTRQNVGIELGLSYELRGDVVILDGEVELSSVDPATAGRTSPSFRSLCAVASAPIVGTKATPFASLYDVGTKRRYEVTVAATKVM